MRAIRSSIEDLRLKGTSIKDLKYDLRSKFQDQHDQKSELRDQRSIKLFDSRKIHFGFSNVIDIVGKGI